jgi:hypothetical protein
MNILPQPEFMDWRNPPECTVIPFTNPSISIAYAGTIRGDKGEGW